MTLSFDVDALVALPRPTRLSPSPCGRFAAVEVRRLTADGARYVGDLWRISLTDPAAPPVALTAGEHDDSAPTWHADGRLLFLSDRPTPSDPTPAGRRQIWALPPTGEARPLTDDPVGVQAFATGGDAIVARVTRWPGVAPADQRGHGEARGKTAPSALHYAAMPVRHWDHWLSPAAPHLLVWRAGAAEPHDLTPAGEPGLRDAPLVISEDGRAVATLCQRTDAGDHIPDTHAVVFRLASGERLALSGGARCELSHPLLSAAGDTLIAHRELRQDDGAHRHDLVRFDLARPAAAPQPLTAGWDARPLPVALDADAAYVLSDTRGHQPIFRVPLAGGAPSRLTGDGAWAAVARAGDALVGLHHTLCQPPEPWRVPLDGEAPRPLASLTGFDAAAAAAAVVIEPIDVAGAGGTPVHGFLVRPRAAAAPCPLLLWIHGGPESQHVDGWHWRWNALLAAAAGYAVALPNPRGSTGYGRQFTAEVWNNQFGAACYHDLMAVTDALAAHPQVDADQAIAMGGSFGGYMANWIGTQTDRFRGLITHAGLSHLSAFHGDTDLPGWFALGQGGAPDAVGAAFDRYSPLAHLDGWRTPVLILHGERDFRVPVSEALRLFEGLTRRGVPAELVVYPDENHWIGKPANIRHWYQTWQAFAAAQLSAG